MSRGLSPVKRSGLERGLPSRFGLLPGCRTCPATFRELPRMPGALICDRVGRPASSRSGALAVTGPSARYGFGLARPRAAARSALVRRDCAARAVSEAAEARAAASAPGGGSSSARVDDVAGEALALAAAARPAWRREALPCRRTASSRRGRRTRRACRRSRGTARRPRSTSREPTPKPSIGRTRVEQCRDRVLVEIPAREDRHLGEPRLVENLAHAPAQLEQVARVEPDRAERSRRARRARRATWAARRAPSTVS